MSGLKLGEDEQEELSNQRSVHMEFRKFSVDSDFAKFTG